MNRFIAIFILLFLSTTAYAQLEIKQGSFKEVPGFINANPDKQLDDNDKPFSVIKIKTVNISDKQRRELVFQGSLGTYFEKEYKVGEMWIYISYTSEFIKISHNELSSVDFYFPQQLEPKKGYELTLVNKTAAPPSGFGTITIRTVPESGADISIDGVSVGKQSPSEIMLPAQDYTVSVSKTGFYTATDNITIKANENISIELTMRDAYGDIIVKTEPSGSAVYIDETPMGITPLSLKQKIKEGSHLLRISGKNCISVTKDINVVKDSIVNIFEQLQTEKTVTVKTEKAGNQIYIDDNYVGTSPVTTTLKFGEHKFKAIDNGVEVNTLATVELIPTPQTIVIDFYNYININSDRAGDRVFIDDNLVGVTPYSDEIKCGNHIVKVVGLYNTKEQAVSIDTDGDFTFDFNLHTGRSIKRQERLRLLGNMLFRGWYIGPYAGFNSILYSGSYFDDFKFVPASMKIYHGVDPEFFSFKWEGGTNAAVR